MDRYLFSQYSSYSEMSNIIILIGTYLDVYLKKLLINHNTDNKYYLHQTTFNHN